jgi:ParB/RepB/Spo0J family partition protein
MAVAVSGGEYAVSRGRETLLADPRAIQVDWKSNLSRGGRPVVDAELKSLARSMLTTDAPGDSEEGSSGQIEPIICRRDDQKRPVIVAGYRRLAAGLWLLENGHPEFQIRFDVRECNDAEAALLNIEENAQRLELEPLQLARAVKKLSDLYNMPLKAVANRLKKSANWLRQITELLDLPSEIKKSVEAGKTSTNAALELTRLHPDDRESVHREAKEQSHKGKVRAAAVRQVAVERGVTGPKPRTTRQFRDWLEQRIRPGEHPDSKQLAIAIRNYLDGKPKSEERLNSTWDAKLAPTDEPVEA